MESMHVIDDQPGRLTECQTALDAGVTQVARVDVVTASPGQRFVGDKEPGHERRAEAAAPVAQGLGQHHGILGGQGSADWRYQRSPARDRLPASQGRIRAIAGTSR